MGFVHSQSIRIKEFAKPSHVIDFLWDKRILHRSEEIVLDSDSGKGSLWS
jgi:hypothetical protein